MAITYSFLTMSYVFQEISSLSYSLMGITLRLLYDLDNMSNLGPRTEAPPKNIIFVESFSAKSNISPSFTQTSQRCSSGLIQTGP